MLVYQRVDVSLYCLSLYGVPKLIHQALTNFRHWFDLGDQAAQRTANFLRQHGQPIFWVPLLGDVWPILRWFWLVYVWSMELIAVRRISEAIRTIYHPHVRKSNWAKCWKNARMFDAETHPDLVGVLGDSALWVSSPQLQLVVFRPTPLKNDGVKVSWDHDIPNLWKVIFFSVPNHQPDKLGKFSASWNLCDYPQTRGTTGTTNIN